MTDIVICESSNIKNGYENVIARFGSLDQAIEYALYNYDILMLDRDEHNNNCADFITKQLGIFTIQPENLKR